MVVLVVEKVSAGLRGEITRWMLEPRTGVFVGSVNAMVREKLWEKVRDSVGSGGALMVFSSNTEQGFIMRSFGATSREIVTLEGMALPLIPNKDDLSRF